MAAIELATCQAMVLYDCSRRVHHIWVTKMKEGKIVLSHLDDCLSEPGFLEGTPRRDAMLTLQRHQARYDR